MKKNIKNNKILSSENQIYLHGYAELFNSFSKLFNIKKMPNALLISGSKGLGKSTFIYHFVNYILSSNEENKYDKSNFIINSKNRSYNLVKSNLHPNFFSLEKNQTDSAIGIDQVRSLLNFLNKTTNSENLKLILIDNVEDLNLNSSNALLKALEEPNINTFFFLIYNNEHKILNTLKSRCSEFKIHFTKNEKDKIFMNLLENYNIDSVDDEIFNFLKYVTPGNLLNYLISLDEKYSDMHSSKINFITDSIKIYEKDKNKNLFYTITFLIEKFYYDLCLKNLNDFNRNFYNYRYIIKQIYYLKKYNLNEKSTLKSISNMLHNETR